MGTHRFKFVFHYSFIILFVLSIIFSRWVLMLEYFICLIAHEMVHAAVAKKRGYKIGRINLMATGAVLEAESDEFLFGDEILIAISAPLFNLALAFFIVALWWIFPESYNYTLDLCVVNLALCGFNLLPIFPLDGGRVLLACLSKRFERKTAVRVARIVALVFVLLIFVLFIISLFISPNFSLGLISITLFVGAVSEDKSASYKRAFAMNRKIERTKKRGLEVRYVYVNKDVDDYKLLSLINMRTYTIFIIVDESLEPVGRIDEKEVLNRFSTPTSFNKSN